MILTRLKDNCCIAEVNFFQTGRISPGETTGPVRLELTPKR